MSDQPQKEKSVNYESNFKWKSDELDDLLMKRIYEVYHVEEEPEESEDDEEVDGDADQDQEDDPEPLPDGRANPIQSYEPSGTWKDAIIAFWTSLSTVSRVLTYLIVLWPLSYFSARCLFGGPIKSMDRGLVTSLLVVPCGILMGINGLLILFNQNTDETMSLEESGSFRFILGVFSMLLGWGAAAYFAWNYFSQELSLN